MTLHRGFTALSAALQTSRDFFYLVLFQAVLAWHAAAQTKGGSQVVAADLSSPTRPLSIPHLLNHMAPPSSGRPVDLTAATQPLIVLLVSHAVFVHF